MSLQDINKNDLLLPHISALWRHQGRW